MPTIRATVRAAPIWAAPRRALGVYTVVASFAGSNDYASASSNPATFTISQAAVTVIASDVGGAYNSGVYPATATIAGVGSQRRGRQSGGCGTDVFLLLW